MTSAKQIPQENVENFKRGLKINDQFYYSILIRGYAKKGLWDKVLPFIQ